LSSHAKCVGLLAGVLFAAPPEQESRIAPTVGARSPIARTYFIEVIRTSVEVDARIELLRSDPRVTHHILVLDSQSHFHERP